MSWKKYFRIVDTNGTHSPINGSTGGQKAVDGMGYSNYGSMLPEVYMGHPNRVERYNQYESMDLDSEVNSALDILSEFSTQVNSETNLAFNLHFLDTPTETEAKILKKQLQVWYNLNEFNKRIFKIFRNVLKYGDQIFLRDPETFKLFYVDVTNVIKVIVNESDGKKPEQYIIRNINPNFENLTVTAVTADNLFYTAPNTAGYGAAAYNMPNNPYSTNNRFVHGLNEKAVEAQHIMHLSLTEGLDPNWPFGNSILELIFKVYKQKELLEDAIIIYRVQRAPERRVFYIDVGDMPSHLAMAFVDRVKNEIHQRRIPTAGGGGNFMDSTYYPTAINQDFYFPQTASGRGSKVETLPGGCLDMSTRVPLLDGRILTLNELTNEYQSGKENWAYSCNPETGDFAPGLISWAGVTQESAEVMRLTLDNDEVITCTPDHKFPILGKGFVEAKDILVNQDSLISFNIQNKFISEHKKRDYTQIYNHSDNSWKFVHREVTKILADTDIIKEWTYDEKYFNDKKDVIHHKNHNRYNNDPSNLIKMSFWDHKTYHQANGFSKEDQQRGTIAAKAKMLWLKENDIENYNYIRNRSVTALKNQWNNYNEEEEKQRCESISDGIKNYFDNLSEEDRIARGEISKNNFYKGTISLQNKLKDPEYNKEFGEKISSGWDDYKKDNKSGFKKRSKKIANANKKRHATEDYTENIFKQQRIKVDEYFIGQIQNIIKNENITSMKKLLIKINTTNLLDYFLDINKDTKCNHNWKRDKFSHTHLTTALQNRGYKNWTHFRNEILLYNHKVVKIEFIGEMQVGTLTIDSDEKYHNYHTFALACGVYTKNSNLGEIDDLRHFTNKMMRGLRIPSSYLPTGPDDSPVTSNDGRVGTALIQEFRFNQYCQRLQNLICDPLDLEFKAFLKWTGVNIDVSTFKLCFNEPQNFAHYRESELDQVKIGTFSQLEQYPYFSKRFLIQRYLGLTVEEMAENDELWREEHDEPDDEMSEPANLRNLGITPGGIDADIDNFAEPDMEGGEGAEAGAGNAAPPGGGAPEGGGGNPGGSSPTPGNI